jgi:phytoene synthase
MSHLSPCALEARRLDNDRFLCALAAPAGKREALFALLALDGELAGIRSRAKEPLLRRMRLAWWRETLESVVAGAPAPRHPVAEALAAAVRTHDLSGESIRGLLDAREDDLDDEPHPDPEALAAATGAPLARLMLEVLGFRDGPVVAAATGVATAHSLADQCRAGRAPPALAETAASHLKEARRLLPRPPKAALPALLPAILIESRLRRPPWAGRGAWPLIRLVLAAWRGRF